MADRRSGDCDAGRPWHRLRLERVSNSADACLWMEHLAGYPDFRIGDPRAWSRCFRGRAVDEADRSAPNGGDRRSLLRGGGGTGRANAPALWVGLSLFFGGGGLLVVPLV